MSLLALLLLSTAYAQQPALSRYEYWIDQTQELLTQGTLSQGETQQLDWSIDASSLPEGLHHFYCRFQDNNGAWSSPTAHPFYVKALPKNDKVEVASVEYWIDSNERQALTVNDTTVAFTVDAAALTEGLHTLNYRLKDNEGRYSPLTTWLFVRETLRDTTIANAPASIEYWVDSISNGVHYATPTGNDFSFSLSTEGLSDGLHKLVYRIKDVLGHYSAPSAWMFMKTANKGINRVAWCRYWWNDRTDLAVREEVQADSCVYLFERDLVVPEYAMTDNDSETPTAVLHVQFGDTAGNISETLTTSINYTARVFQIDPNDLLALRNLYNRFNGSAWTRPWTFSDSGFAPEDFPGVSFTEPNELGNVRVAAIDLSDNNLKGDVSGWTLYFPELKTLLLRDNALTGDLTPFVASLTSLVTLDVSSNALTGLTALPASVKSLKKGSQFTTDATAALRDNAAPALCYISEKQQMTLPTLFTYSLADAANVATRCYLTEQSETTTSGYFATLMPQTDGTCATTWRYSPYVYEQAQDRAIWLHTADGSIYPATLRYVDGDADMSGYTDLLDVQSTISEILNPALISLFNLSAANTYSDAQLNVQDVVCTVNIVLSSDHTATAAALRPARLKASGADDYTPANCLYTEGGMLWMQNNDEVAAIEVTLSGVSADEVSLRLPASRFQMASRNTDGGSRHIIYSLSGHTIAAGTTALMRIADEQAEPIQATLSDLSAKALGVALGRQTTGIAHTESTGKPTARLEGSTLTIDVLTALHNARIQVVGAAGQTVATFAEPHLEAGRHRLALPHLTPGIYLVHIAADSLPATCIKLVQSNN